MTESSEKVNIGRGNLTPFHSSDMDVNFHILSLYMDGNDWINWASDEVLWAVGIVQQFPTDTKFESHRTSEGLSLKLLKNHTWNKRYIDTEA